MWEQLEAFCKLNQDLKDQHRAAEKNLDELEYAIIIDQIWKVKALDGIGGHRIKVKLDAARDKGYLILERSDGAYQKYPVRVAYGFHQYDDRAGLADIWDGGYLPPRLFEVLLTRWTGRCDDVRRKKRLDTQERLGAKATGATPLGYVEYYPPGDEVRAVGVLDVEGLPEMVPSTSTEGSEGEERT